MIGQSGSREESIEGESGQRGRFCGERKSGKKRKKRKERRKRLIKWNIMNGKVKRSKLFELTLVTVSNDIMI